jgi:hypothetical protein
MENDTINLIDCLRVIRKRKILVIAVSLICMVAAVVINLTLKELYRAEAIIAIGQKIDPDIGYTLKSSVIDGTKNVKKNIYAISELNKKSSKYDFSVGRVNDTETMLRVVVKGTDMGSTKEILEEIVNELYDDHLRIRKNSIQYQKAYYERERVRLKTAIETMKADIKEMNDDISYVRKQLVAMKAEKADPMSIGFFMKMNWDWERDDMVGVKKRNLSAAVSNYEKLDNSEKEITDSENREKDKTRMVGSVKVRNVNLRAMKLFVPAAGAVGFTISLFLILFIECVRERGDGKKDSV